MLLTEKVDGPRLLLLGGRSWRVTWTDWKRRRCFVEPADGGGKARWLTPGISGRASSWPARPATSCSALTRRCALTQRAERSWPRSATSTCPPCTPAAQSSPERGDDVRWWTWAGYRANATLAATLSSLADSVQRFDDASLRLRADLTPEMWKAGIGRCRRTALPARRRRAALAGLKFNEALPERLAIATLAARLADLDSALQALAEPVRFTVKTEEL